MNTKAPARRTIPAHVKLTVALKALGLKESDIDWSHEPALGLRAINERGTDYDPPQNDPEYIFIRKRAEHDHLTFKDNGSGRSDLAAIAHVKRTVKKAQEHKNRLVAKTMGRPVDEQPRSMRKMASRPFSKKPHRSFRGKNAWAKV